MVKLQGIDATVVTTNFALATKLIYNLGFYFRTSSLPVKSVPFTISFVAMIRYGCWTASEFFRYLFVANSFAFLILRFLLSISYIGEHNFSNNGQRPSG